MLVEVELDAPLRKRVSCVPELVWKHRMHHDDKNKLIFVGREMLGALEMVLSSGRIPCAERFALSDQPSGTKCGPEKAWKECRGYYIPNHGNRRSSIYRAGCWERNGFEIFQTSAAKRPSRSIENDMYLIFLKKYLNASGMP